MTKEKITPSEEFTLLADYFKARFQLQEQKLPEEEGFDQDVQDEVDFLEGEIWAIEETLLAHYKGQGSDYPDTEELGETKEENFYTMRSLFALELVEDFLTSKDVPEWLFDTVTNSLEEETDLYMNAVKRMYEEGEI